MLLVLAFGVGILIGRLVERRRIREDLERMGEGLRAMQEPAPPVIDDWH